MLEVNALTVDYGGTGRRVRALDDVTLAVPRGHSLGVIGESGCGKTTLALAILCLLPPAARLVCGSITLEGAALAGLTAASLRKKRWTQIAYVPQGAINALDPVRTLHHQFEATARAHGGVPHLRRRAEELFRQVELDPALLDRYPHQFSGGMRQRAAIALALLFDPPFLIADEPTTGLDVLVQREVLDVLGRVQCEREMTLLIISHDLGVIGELCDRVAVMYAGRIVETGPTATVLGRPMHPYTIGLRLAYADIADPDRSPISIPGSPPSAGAAPAACSFAPRCPFVLPLCSRRLPPLRRSHEGEAACHRFDEAAALRQASREPAAWSASQTQ